MRRISAAHGYLVPALNRENLTLLTDAPVRNSISQRGECRGVFVGRRARTRRIAAARK